MNERNFFTYKLESGTETETEIYTDNDRMGVQSCVIIVIIL